jgi:hypothetical protein
VTPPIEGLPDGLESLNRLLAAERMARINAEAKAVSPEATTARAAANMSSAEALIAHLKLAIEKMRWVLYGSRSNAAASSSMMELEVDDLEATTAEDEIAAEMAATKVGCIGHAGSGLRARLGPQTQGSFLKPLEFLARERDRGFS